MQTRTAAWKRYNWRLIWLSLFYAAFLLLAVYGFKHRLVPDALKYLVAVLPALPIIGIFAALGRYLVEEGDEYVRMLMVRQILWASGLTLSVATIWGFLDNFGLVGHADGYWLIALWFVGLGLGGIVNKLTLGDGGC
jgi:Na+-driven multidrug efflux pump